MLMDGYSHRVQFGPTGTLLQAEVYFCIVMFVFLFIEGEEQRETQTKTRTKERGEQ